MKYILIILLALALGCQKDLVKLTLENTCADESLVELMLNDEITMSATSLKQDVELLLPDTYTIEATLYRDGWTCCILVYDTIEIDQDMTCYAFYYDLIAQEEILLWWE